MGKKDIKAEHNSLKSLNFARENYPHTYLL